MNVGDLTTVYKGAMLWSSLNFEHAVFHTFDKRTPCVVVAEIETSRALRGRWVALLTPTGVWLSPDVNLVSPDSTDPTRDW